MASATEQPFLPGPDIPDYVASVRIKLSHGPVVNEVRTYHGGWTRVDGGVDRNAYRSTSYFGPEGLIITFARDPSEREGHDWLHVMRGSGSAHLIRWGQNPFKTSDSEVVAGESCEVWNLSQAFLSSRARRLSCITPDGIELWSRVENDFTPGNSFEITSLERTRVERDAVRLPDGKLDLNSWLTTPPPENPPDPPGDVTVILQSTTVDIPFGVRTRTIRRHFPWTSTEDVKANSERTISFKNELQRLNIVFESDAAGQPIRLSIQKALRTFSYSSPPDSGHSEILGEACTIHQETGRESYSYDCVTADGLPLKAIETDLHERNNLVAVKLDRSPLALDVVMPPPELFRRRTWGIPD
ncbi:hypothetical protein S58_25420 [Bradyrhizobium oligotrophicum S58]|uniref:Uncharacterized protein n=1 Tax=Bradyrhizobium oligotrophicum S58 TaxID=1245469 RepID=M4Z528_9BRAD|nr:hypothetical protein S58_25420 [Bradyrhizobium oligotrophicum S58]